MPARKTTVPRAHTAADVIRAHNLKWPKYAGAVSAVTDFVAFTEFPENKDLVFPTAVEVWAGQQLNDLDKRVGKKGSPNYVAGRVEIVMKYRPSKSTLSEVIARIRLGHLPTALRRTQTLTRPVIRAPWMSLPFLALWLPDDDTVSSCSDEDIYNYAFTFLILSAGSRPDSIWNASHIDLSPSGYNLHRTKTKNEQDGRGLPVKIKFVWSLFPPEFIRAFLCKRGRCGDPLPWQKYASAETIAGRIDDFLSVRYKDKNIAEKFIPTTKFFRVRMDNHLGQLHDQGNLTTHVFEHIMEHELKTSQKYYRRDKEIDPFTSTTWKKDFVLQQTGKGV